MNLQKDLTLSLDTSVKLQECMEIKYLNATELQMITLLGDITLDALSYKTYGLDIFNDSRLLQSVFLGSLVSNKTFATVVGLQLRSMDKKSFKKFQENISIISNIKCFSCNICSNTIDLLHTSTVIFMKYNMIVCKQCKQYIKID